MTDLADAREHAIDALMNPTGLAYLPTRHGLGLVLDPLIAAASADAEAQLGEMRQMRDSSQHWGESWERLYHEAMVKNVEARIEALECEMREGAETLEVAVGHQHDIPCTVCAVAVGLREVLADGERT